MQSPVTSAVAEAPDHLANSKEPHKSTSGGCVRRFHVIQNVQCPLTKRGPVQSEKGSRFWKDINWGTQEGYPQRQIDRPSVEKESYSVLNGLLRGTKQGLSSPPWTLCPAPLYMQGKEIWG